MTTYSQVLSRLPPEIWLTIIRWATCPPSGFPAPFYEPFRTSFEEFEEPLKTKRAVVRVCRLWRALATSILYEDVRVRHGAQSLREVLESGCAPGNESGCRGRWVRRLELPYGQTDTASPDGPTIALRILNHCPSLETLVRPFMREIPDVVRYEFPAESVPLPSLTRLEWWHYNNAARSGGINSLTHVLRNTPSLQFLTVGGEFWMSSTMSNCLSLRLPALTTLRLRRVNALFVRLICQWELPSLVHVVVDFPPDHNALEALWATFGHQLCTVELGRNIVFLMNEQISVFLRGCPSVKIFNYFIYFTAVPRATQVVEHSSLQCVGIHAFPCAMVTDVRMEHLNRHFNFLAGPYLPALRRVILYGDWREIMVDQLFITFRDRLVQKGCAIGIVDGATIPPCEYLCTPTM
ncbi:hypothetical protein F5I97DRAFT_1189128 [Phlebopus sp. FC_14]|nr:hypothetical protein F5I97DRAFT_1189128 [Phlebopus sp. FC_14]